VIGIGSSGIQVISKIASQVKQLYAWVKSPTWITAGFAQRFAGPNGGNFHCKSDVRKDRRGWRRALTVGIDTPEQQKRFAENPQLFLKYSKMIESELNQRFKFILNGTPEAEGAREVRLP